MFGKGRALGFFNYIQRVRHCQKGIRHEFAVEKPSPLKPGVSNVSLCSMPVNVRQKLEDEEMATLQWSSNQANEQFSWWTNDKPWFEPCGSDSRALIGYPSDSSEGNEEDAIEKGGEGAAIQLDPAPAEVMLRMPGMKGAGVGAPVC